MHDNYYNNSWTLSLTLSLTCQGNAIFSKGNATITLFCSISLRLTIPPSLSLLSLAHFYASTSLQYVTHMICTNTGQTGCSNYIHVHVLQSCWSTQYSTGYRMCTMYICTCTLYMYQNTQWDSHNTCIIITYIHRRDILPPSTFCSMIGREIWVEPTATSKCLGPSSFVFHERDAITEGLHGRHITIIYMYVCLREYWKWSRLW